ncbi:hypothetical protein [Candidatus Clostridium stratigraminis]|uniref:Uncharacterized protein n=1 Tax=Candidatus Clostridium stratigraminis TaxID=3381661 RepID=A0ABW8T3X6_9CLOT
MINYKRLKKDLLNEMGPSGIMPAIIDVDNASEDKLIKIAAQYGLDIEEYIEEDKL